MLRSGQSVGRAIAASPSRRGGLAVARSSPTAIATLDDYRQQRHLHYHHNSTTSTPARSLTTASVQRRQNGRGTRGGNLTHLRSMTGSPLSLSATGVLSSNIASSRFGAAQQRSLSGWGGWWRGNKLSEGPSEPEASSPDAAKTTADATAGADSAASPEVAPPPVGGAVDTSVASTVTDVAQQVDPAVIEAGTEWYLVPMEYCVDSIHGLSVATGMPYWGSIVLITVGIRLMILPLSVVSTRNAMRLGIVKPELDLLKQAMERDTKTPQMKKAERFRREMKSLLKYHKCNFRTSFLFGLFQMPIFLTLFNSLRYMGEYYPAYSTSGILWFQDLGAPDPYGVLPIATAASFFYMMEMGADGFNTSATTPGMKVALRGMPFIMVPVMLHQPAGIFFYWTVSNVFSITQTRMLKRPAVKKMLDVPDAPPPPPPPSLAGEDITWIHVLGARNPRDMYEAMRKQKLRNEYVDREQGVFRDGAPLPPPPPVISDEQMKGGSNVQAIEAEMVESDRKVETALDGQVLHVTNPKKAAAGAGGRSGSASKKKDPKKKARN